MLFKIARYFWVVLCGMKNFSIENRIGRLLLILFTLIIVLSITYISYSAVKFKKEIDFISIKTLQIDSFENNFASKRFYEEFTSAIEQVETDFVQLNGYGILLDEVSSFNIDKKFNELGLSTALRNFLDEIKYGNNYPDGLIRYSGVMDQANIFAKRLQKDWWWGAQDFSREQLAIYLVDYYVIMWNACDDKIFEQNYELAVKALEHWKYMEGFRDNYLNAKDPMSEIEGTYGIEAYELEKIRDRESSITKDKSNLFKTKVFPAEYTRTFEGLYMYSEYLDPFAVKSNISWAKRELSERDSKSYENLLFEFGIVLLINFLIIVLLRLFYWVRG